MGGLGKSTLASKLYHSSELSHFRSRAWVCVSKDDEITHVLRKLIKSFNEHEKDILLNEMEEGTLLRCLRKILLDGDHYLAVIDDIWDLEVWKKIKNAFPDKKDGSRVILTTRNKTIVKGVDDIGFVHELRFLREEESWQLFWKRAKPTPNLEILGKEMVGKCGGLPLAIVILSGLLLQNKTYTFWSGVKDHLWKKLKGKSSEIQELLNLSYEDLSPQTRQCFLYLARFPEDHIINVFDLKLLWIAEEFVSESDEEDGEDMEDVAEDYVNELVNRNVIQIELLYEEGQVLSCRVHDLVRDLALQKAMEQKILGIFDSSKEHPNPSRLLQGQTRHVIQNGIGEYLDLFGFTSDNLKLLSFALINSTSSLKVEEMKLMYKRFKYLKVLDLTSVKNSEVIPEVIGDLILLKFLGLMGSDSVKALVIPPSIGDLKKLQTLHGSGYNGYEFPKELCELKELRHLIFSNVKGNLNIGSKQTKLQTLNCILCAEWFQIDTINLPNLRTLIIGQNMDEIQYEYSVESLANLTRLRALSLCVNASDILTLQPLSSCKHLKKVSLLGTINDAAELSFLPDSVTDLTLTRTGFTEDPMPILKSLPNLTALCLGRGFYRGDRMVCSADSFPYLRYLTLDDILHPKEFQVDDASMLKSF